MWKWVKLQCCCYFWRSFSTRVEKEIVVLLLNESGFEDENFVIGIGNESRWSVIKENWISGIFIE